MKRALQGLFPDELEALCREAGEGAFRGRQLWQWVQGRHALSWEEMKNVPGRLKTALDAADWTPAAVAARRESVDSGGTVKWLLGLDDGEGIEMVRIPGGGGRETVCISTQVGCRMGCAFCATAKSGFARSLSAGEMAAQVHFGTRAIGRRPDNVVLMGMGEPFDNYDEVLKGVRLLNHRDGLGIGARKITISTCGVVPGIRRLAGEGLQVELSVSLHAPNPEIRRKLMPAERRWPMEDVLKECAAYTAKTKRIVTFEYTLVKDLNDRPEHAAELARRLRTFPSRVNLIPLSPVEEFAGETPSRARIDGFLRELARFGVEGTVRESRGKGVNGACGQLRRASAKGPSPQE